MMDHQEEDAANAQHMLTASLPEAALADVVELKTKLRACRSPQVVSIYQKLGKKGSSSLNSAVPTLMAGSRIWSLRKRPLLGTEHLL